MHLHSDIMNTDVPVLSEMRLTTALLLAFRSRHALSGLLEPITDTRKVLQVLGNCLISGQESYEF